MMKLSLAQKKALNPHLSCWVEASAGTGKTKVLTDRILSLLLSDVETSEILCLTFTKAAGAEMANRLRLRLHQWATANNEILQQELEDFLGHSVSERLLIKAKHLFYFVLNNPYGIRIQTIHGFCQSLLRAFPLEADLLPHFKIMGGVEKKELLLKTWAQIWKYLDQETVSYLTKHFSEEQLLEYIDFFLDHKTILSTVPVKELVQNLSCYLSLDQDSLIRDENNFLEQFFKRILTIDEEIFSFKKATASDLKLIRSVMDFEEYSSTEKATYFQKYKSLFLTNDGIVRKRLYSKSIQEHFPDLALALSDEAKNIQTIQEYFEKKKILDRSHFLMQAAVRFIEIYERLKLQKSWLDYDDLILYGCNLLKKSHLKPWILEKLDYKLQHILIDEAQDTSHLQWELILALIEEFYADKSQAKTLFVVGDLKQSIYSFQGASPQAFMQAKEAFQKLPQREMIDLSTSYRSTPAVLNFVDHVFKSTNLGGKENLVAHEISRHGASGIVELWPLVKEEQNSEKETWEVPNKQYRQKSSRHILAQKIACQLEKWFQTGELIHSHNRPLEPRDVMILVRRRDSFIEELVKALKERNIPVTGLDRMVLLDQLAIKDILCLCDVILLPEDDLNLATLLKSPFFAVSEEEVFHFCQGRKEKPLWEYLKTIARGQKIVDEILSLQQVSQKKSSHEFLSYILITWGGRQKLLERLGPEIEDALEELLSICQIYEEGYGFSLQQFVCWVRQQDVEVKRSLEQTEDNQVRIMTVHGSKGLQAPVVFLPDTAQMPTMKFPLIWNDSPPFLVWADGNSRKLRGIETLFTKDRSIQEYYRLLYVAMTRAEDRLYICGWEPRKGMDPQCWYALLETSMKEIGVTIEIDSIGQSYQYGTLDSLSVKKKIKKSSLLHLEEPPLWLKTLWHPQKTNVVLPSVTVKEEVPDVSTSLHQQKGLLIHKILQWVVKAKHRSEWPSLITTYLQKINMGEKEKRDILSAVEAVLYHEDFPLLFNKNTKTEVPIQGWWQNQKVRGIIDVLTISDTEKKIYVLDYKTGAFLESYRHTPPEPYKRQMSLYKALLQEIYPDYEITSALLWTKIKWIQKI